MTCLLCDELSSRFDLSVENNWQSLTPLYIQVLNEHAEMCHCEEYEMQTNKYMTVPLEVYRTWTAAQLNPAAEVSP